MRSQTKTAARVRREAAIDKTRIFFYLHRLREQLWFRPLLFSLLSVAAIFLAMLADGSTWAEDVPRISPNTNIALLEIMGTSMLMIATFAVASMVSAYSSASRVATPRSFAVVVADDPSQNALSAFVGAFIYSIIALAASLNEFYDRGGRFVLFVLTMTVFALVVLTFVRWVNRIARLGRMGNTIEKVEAAAGKAVSRYQKKPAMGGVPATGFPGRECSPVHTNEIGYIQDIDIPTLQKHAEKIDCRFLVVSLPGAFVGPGHTLVSVAPGSCAREIDQECIQKAFVMGDSRVFEDDPRFGFVVLAEIAARALSPAVNDPGTAIDILGAFVRLLAAWVKPPEADEDEEAAVCDRVFVPRITVADLFQDAFTSVSRDGARSVEVGVRLQQAFTTLASADNEELAQAARRYSGLALVRARATLELPDDFDRVLAASRALNPSVE